MKRIRLTVAYDGTDFHGFQMQDGYRTVEGLLSDVITELTGRHTLSDEISTPVGEKTLSDVITEPAGERIVIYGASRTDAGVHARGNIVVFDTDSTIPPERFAPAMNTKLPADLRVLCSEEIASDWFPHGRPQIKTYSYRVFNERIYDPLVIRYAMTFFRKLDLTAMQQAAEQLVGEHDFTSFSNPASQVLQNGGSAVRRIESITVTSAKFPEGIPGETQCTLNEKQGITEGISEETLKEISKGEKLYLGDLKIIVRGNGFLYNMVRIIAGTLLEVGTGRFTPDDMSRILKEKDRTKAGLTAPPQGLCLERIQYLE